MSERVTLERTVAEPIKGHDTISQVASKFGAYLMETSLLKLKIEDLMAGLSEDEQYAVLGMTGKISGISTKEWEPQVIRGISLVNPRYHLESGQYRRLSDDEDAVQVIEMANLPSPCEPIKGDELGRHKVHVFTRYISAQKRQENIDRYKADPETYLNDQLRSLGEGGE